MPRDAGGDDVNAGGEGDLAAGRASGMGSAEASKAAAQMPPASMLAAGAEFDLIRRFLQGASSGCDVLIGPGDDAAVVSGGIVLSSDISVENRHFRREWMSPFDIGYRAAAASLSDLAAMAARPIGALASIAISPADAGEYAVEIMRGVRAMLDSVGGSLLGGDLTSSPGPIFIDIVSVGQSSLPVRRSGARPGDELWVTGSLGGAGLAVADLLAGTRPPATAMSRLTAPTPRIHEALWLADQNLPAAMLDISDGLGGDVAHMAAASGVVVLLDAQMLPVHPSLESVEGSRRVELALSGGEDYEICFAARAGTVQPHVTEFRAVFGCDLTKVGRIEAGEGVFLEKGGERVPLHGAGFQHFQEGR